MANITTPFDEPLFLQVGRKRYQVASLEHASAMFSQTRDAAMASGLGPDDVPPIHVVNATGKKVARISWNGRVWPIAPWHSGMQPLAPNVVPLRAAFASVKSGNMTFPA
jgi:hypothetical protein